MFKIKAYSLIVIAILNFLIFGCSKPDPTTGEVVRTEPDPDKKAAWPTEAAPQFTNIMKSKHFFNFVGEAPIVAATIAVASR